MTVTLAPSKPDDGTELSRRTKAGDYDSTVVHGDDASSCAGRGFVVDVLKYLKAENNSLKHIFPINFARYEQLIATACRELGLNKLQLTPYSARYDGPSVDMARGLRTRNTIQRRGL